MMINIMSNERIILRVNDANAFVTVPTFSFLLFVVKFQIFSGAFATTCPIFNDSLPATAGCD